MHPHPAVIRLRRLPARYAGLVMPLILSLIMTFVVSAFAMGYLDKLTKH